MKKLLILALSFALILMVSGCAKEASKDIMTIGIDDSYPPMEFVNDAGELDGFDIDFAKALSEQIGMEIEFKSTAWDGIFTGLTSGNYDVIISSVSVTEDRIGNYDISIPYLANGQVIVVPAGAEDITDIEGLAGKKVGVQIETTSHNSARKALETVEFEISAYDQIVQTFMDLKAGRLDAIIVDGMVAGEYLQNEPDTYSVSSAKLSNEPIAVYFKLDANKDLLEKVNSGIKALQENGKLTEISMKWFGADYTSNIDSSLW